MSIHHPVLHLSDTTFVTIHMSIPTQPVVSYRLQIYDTKFLQQQIKIDKIF